MSDDELTNIQTSLPLDSASFIIDAALAADATLVDAQAIGDYEALSSAGRRVARLRLGEDAAGAVRKLAESV